MSANVRCAGRRALPAGISPPGDMRTVRLPPCGWKGIRAVWWVTFPATFPNHNEYQRRATAKPCPRCGGTVQLISEDQRAGGGR